MYGGSHILYCSRIRKNVTSRETENKHTENSITEATLSPYQWNAGLSGPTEQIDCRNQS